MVYDVQTGGRLAITLYPCGVSSTSLVSGYPAEKLGQGEGARHDCTLGGKLVQDRGSLSPSVLFWLVPAF